jgi:hypothetical protein
VRALTPMVNDESIQTRTSLSGTERTGCTITLMLLSTVMDHMFTART